MVQSGSDSYSVSVDNGATKTGKVELNTTDVTYGDDANGIGTDKASMSGQLIKVGTDDKGTVTGYVTVQGKNYGVDAGYLANSNDSAAPTKTVAGTLEATTGIELSVGSTITKASTEFAGASTNDPLALLDKAIASVDKFRSSLGAVQNRLSSAVTNLNNTTTNLSEAQSRIQDADYATEVSNMSKAQIVQQAGNSVLSKANQVPQQVLSLLQG